MSAQLPCRTLAYRCCYLCGPALARYKRCRQHTRACEFTKRTAASRLEVLQPCLWLPGFVPWSMQDRYATSCLWNIERSCNIPEPIGMRIYPTHNFLTIWLPVHIYTSTIFTLLCVSKRCIHPYMNMVIWKSYRVPQERVKTEEVL